MKQNYDVVVVGAGPAGLSAAVNVQARGKSALVVGSDMRFSPLYKAERIDNHLGMAGLTGAACLQTMTAHAVQSGAELVTGRVLNLMPSGAGFFLSVGNDVVQADAVVLAGGVVRNAKLLREAELLGRGVSYCATCDGMLYRGKTVAVLGYSADAPEEANHLKRIGCEVLYFPKHPPIGLDDGIFSAPLQAPVILGEETVTGLQNDGKEYAVAAVFVHRLAVAPTDLLPELALENGYIQVNRQMETNIPGIYAAGDCTGLPLQLSKAVGEGLVAGQAAADYAAKQETEN